MVSCDDVEVKLSTKNPDLNLFNPFESETKSDVVFVSSKESVV